MQLRWTLDYVPPRPETMTFPLVTQITIIKNAYHIIMSGKNLLKVLQLIHILY